jgi:hypothetical protein
MLLELLAMGSILVSSVSPLIYIGYLKYYDPEKYLEYNNRTHVMERDNFETRKKELVRYTYPKDNSRLVCRRDINGRVYLKIERD